MQSDIEWLGLEPEGEGEWSFELTGPLSRFDGKFYGGTGIAALTATMELATGRAALWGTVQFVGSADAGDRVHCQVEVLATGNRTSQVRFSARVGDRVFLAGLGSAGDVRRGGFEQSFGRMPGVDPPDMTSPWRPRVPFPIDLEQRSSWLDAADIREAVGPDRGYRLWARMRDATQSRASLGFLADMVPTAVARAAGRAGAGTSLDNSMRFGPDPDCEWVLVDFDPYFASRGYSHGGARLWSPDGRLLAVASQSASMLLFD